MTSPVLPPTRTPTPMNSPPRAASSTAVFRAFFIVVSSGPSGPDTAKRRRSPAFPWSAQVTAQS